MTTKNHQTVPTINH